MTESLRAKITVTKVPLHAPQHDAWYWRAQPPEARLVALEEIRREYIQWKYDVQPRVQRVLTIVKR